jgi:hypothetical protein
VCSFVCCVSFDRVLFSVMCVICLLCLIVNHCHRVKTHLQLIILHYITLLDGGRSSDLNAIYSALLNASLSKLQINKTNVLEATNEV